MGEGLTPLGFGLFVGFALGLGIPFPRYYYGFAIVRGCRSRG